MVKLTELKTRNPDSRDTYFDKDFFTSLLAVVMHTDITGKCLTQENIAEKQTPHKSNHHSNQSVQKHSQQPLSQV